MATTPYITAADIRAYLKQVPATEEGLLDAIAVRATARVTTALGFAFGGYTAGTKRLRSYGSDRLWLPPHEPGSVSAVVVSGFTVPTADYTEEDGILVTVGSSWYLFFNGVRGWGVAQYDVTANWGYGEPPADIQEVTLELAVNIFRSKDKGGFSEVVGVEGAGAIRAVAGLTKDQLATIEQTKVRFAGPLAL